MKRIGYALSGLLALCSCQEKIDCWMTDAATATMDKLVGEYVLESIDWSPGLIDLDGDGVADPDLVKEMRAADPSSYHYYSRLTVDMDGSKRYAAKVTWYCIPVEDIDYCAGRSYQNVYWTIFPAGCEIEFDEDGNYVTYPYNSYSDYDSVDGRRETVRYLRSVRYSFEETDRMVFKAETALYDYASDSVQRGTVTYSFKCVSGKGNTSGR